MDAFPSPDDPPHGPPCAVCGRPRSAADAHGLGWSSLHTPDGVEFACPNCTRAEIRQIEAGLPVVRTPAA